MPAAEKERHDNGAAGDHGNVFAQEKETELHRTVFGVVAADQFGFGFGKIEGETIGLGEDGDRENDERDEHRNGQQPFVKIAPIADEGGDHPAVLDLVANDFGEPELADQKKYGNDRQPE